MRTSILSALQRIKCFGEEVSESVRRFGTVIQQIEGGYQVMQTDDNNSAVSDQVINKGHSNFSVQYYFYFMK